MTFTFANIADVSINWFLKSAFGNLENREKYLEIEMGWDAESSSLRSCTEQVSVFAKLLMMEFLK